MFPEIAPIDTWNHWRISAARGCCTADAYTNPSDDADDAGGVVQNDDGKEDAIGNYEAPETLVPGASRRLASNIVGADVGKSFGTDDAHVPYPDTYWPFTDDGIDAAWHGGDPPLEKFMKLADASNLQRAKEWEHDNHGNGVSGAGGWWGQCLGWTGAAMANAPIKHAVNAKFDGGQFVSCTAGSTGCTKLEIGDLNALMAEVYADGDSSFIGAQNGYNTDQIWNQPTYRYTVNRYQATRRPRTLRSSTSRSAG